MRSKINKLLSVAVSVALAITSVCIPKVYSFAADGPIEAGSIDQGQYDNASDISYYLYKGENDDGVLLIDGSGELPAFPEVGSGGGTFQPIYESVGWLRGLCSKTKDEINESSGWKSLGGSLSYIEDLIVGGEVSVIGDASFFGLSCIQNSIRLSKNVVKISNYAFYGDVNVKDMYIYGDIQEVGSTRVFQRMSTTKFHVISDTVKEKIVAAGISDEMVEVDPKLIDDTSLQISLHKAIVIQKMHPNGESYTSGTWEDLTNAIQAGKNYLESAEITDSGVSEKAATIDSAVKGLLSSEALDEALERAEALKESDYTANSWATLKAAVEKGEAGLKDATTEEQISQLAKAITDAIDALVLLTADGAKADLQKVLAKTDSLIESDYTKKSWEALQTALSKANDVKESDVLSEIVTATDNLQKAIDGLAVEYPIEWFALAGIPSGVWHSPILSGKVDKDMAGATKVRITFDCASDTSYNPDTKLTFSMNEDYTDFMGTDGSYTAGKKGLQETLVLSAPLTLGESYELTGDTYSWANAAGDVFTIQTVEFLDDDEIVLKTVEAPAGIADLVTSAIEAAEVKVADLTAGDYTEESITTLKNYIDSLKALENVDKMLPSEINTIRTKLENVTTELTPCDNSAVMATLNESIARAEALNQSDYTVMSWNVLRRALEEAKGATESTVISEVKALNQAVLDAIEGLVETSPGTNTTPNPGASQNPSASQNPGASQNPSASQNPGASQNPSVSQAPNATQGPNASQAPVPTKNPGGPVGTNPTKAPNTPGTSVGNDTQAASGMFVYKITKAATAKKAGAVTVTTLSAAGKKASKLSVPATATINGQKYKVTKLGNNALKGAAAKSITLSKNITAIPKGAFASCKKLSTLTVKGKLKSVKKGAFKGCKKKIKVKGGTKKTRKANVTKLKKSGYKKFK